jgi:hypothetical protein
MTQVEIFIAIVEGPFIGEVVFSEEEAKVIKICDIKVSNWFLKILVRLT